MLKRYFVFPVLLIVSALTFAACGSSGAGDEDQITEAIETLATGTDPANCAKLSTAAFMEQSTQKEGKEASEQCEEEAGEPDKNAESATVSNVEVEGDEATAEVAFTGGGFDGQTLEVALLKEGDQWKLNEVEGFSKLDKTALVEQFEKEFESSSSSGVSEETAVCIEEAFEESTQAEIEEYLLSGSPEAISELVEECS